MWYYELIILEILKILQELKQKLYKSINRTVVTRMSSNDKKVQRFNMMRNDEDIITVYISVYGMTIIHKHITFVIDFVN